MYIDAKTLIELAALLTALGVIGGAALWAVKFVDRQKKQDQELTPPSSASLLLGL